MSTKRRVSNLESRVPSMISVLIRGGLPIHRAREVVRSDGGLDVRCLTTPEIQTFLDSGVDCKTVEIDGILYVSS